MDSPIYLRLYFILKILKKEHYENNKVCVDPLAKVNENGNFIMRFGSL